MSPQESPFRMVMAGSYGSYEPVITIRNGDSCGLMTKSSVSEAKKRFGGFKNVFGAIYLII